MTAVVTPEVTPPAPALATPPAVVPPVVTPPAPVVPPVAAVPPIVPAVPPVKPADVVYDLKAPDGVTVDPALRERTVALARAQGLSPEAGQALFTNTVQELSAQEATRLAEWEPGKGVKFLEYAGTLKKRALADPEIGGSPEKLANSVALAQHAIRTIADGDPKIVERITGFLKSSGLDNHPDAILILSRIGRRGSESSLILGSSAATPGKKSMKDAMYPGDGTGPKPQSTE